MSGFRGGNRSNSPVVGLAAFVLRHRADIIVAEAILALDQAIELLVDRVLGLAGRGRPEVSYT